MKKEKVIITETIHLATNVFENDNFIRQVLEKKEYVSVSKGVHKQKLQLLRILHCFQRKAPKCKHCLLKVLRLENQMVCSGWLKYYSLGLRMMCSSTCCAAC